MKLLYVIPSYEPTEKLIEVVSGILSSPGKLCLVVDDGSGGAYRHLFDAAEGMGAVVVRHGVNLGKGRALKTAFNWFLCNTPDYDGVVTLDSDGQHMTQDVFKCAEAFARSPDAVVLGCRDFDAPQVPFKSRNGNKITRRVFKYLCGINLSDTQTGLRVLPKALLPAMMATKGERFEYETNMLLDTKALDVPMVEVKISTVYENENKGSHFHPLRDSVLVYATFAKYIFSSLSSSVVDIGVYALAVSLLAAATPHYIFAATVVARVISSICNYAINRAWVFKKAGRTTVIKYYILAVCQLLASAFITTWLYRSLPLLGEVGAKIVVDTALFLCSFYIQRNIVFKSNRAPQGQ